MRRWTVADALTLSRVPLGVLFIVMPGATARLVILGLAAGTDLIDGLVARRWGSSHLGAILDPVADKLFMAAAFGVIAASGTLQWFEIVAVLARDIVAAVAFVATLVRRRPASIPARLGGKVVTVGQLLTVLAFLLGSPYLRPIAWATGGIALYAIWDYQRAAKYERQDL
jgi:CDP-diacylglycerol--glycerol-3-phosphate 3-phosphatidyltransferase/cardiolipin synthase